MTDKDLIAKLNSLKNINPDSNWMTSNRDLLLSQISNSGARDLSAWQSFVINLSSFAKAASQPVYALGVFVFVLVTGSLFSHQVFGGAKPNDSLYIARIISEKAKLNTMFNSDERNKLAVQFATDHAKDISNVLADPKFNTEENKDQVAKLNESFDKEIDTVKSKISYLIPSAKVTVPEEVKATGTDIVSIAGNEKATSGVQVLENKSAIDEAKVLFDKKDYTKASDKLKEVDELIK
ncbi:MAG: hypothetical protein ACOYL8_00945 [Patescibacteria group bacterium]